MFKNLRCKLVVETLEDRCVPTANSVALQGGVLGIVVIPNKAHTVVVSQPTAGVTEVALDNTDFTFDTPITQLNYTGGNKNDSFSNLTTVPGTLAFGNGNNLVYSKAAGETITAGNGKNYVQDQAGSSKVTLGNGNDNYYGGPGDSISVGSGHDVVYDILGVDTINVASHRGTDYIFTNAQSTLNGAQADDRVAVFFAANRAAGSGTLVLDQGVLYFTANANGDTYILNQVGNKLVATYNLNDGTGFHTQVFNRSQVKLVANFGGAGNDTFINNTDIPDVQYGQGGNNLIIGGFGVFDLEKAGGAAGNSEAIGRSPVFNDLNGAGSTSATTILIADPRAKNIFRTNNPADQIFGFDEGRDIFISPFDLSHKTPAPVMPSSPPTVSA